MFALIAHMPLAISHRESIDLILRWLRSCTVCGAMWPPIDLVCEDCWHRLTLLQIQNRSEAASSLGYPFSVQVLWQWRPENAALIAPLLYGFKKGWAVNAARTMARALAFARKVDEGERLLFVHPPSANGGFDHSALLAEAFVGCFPGSRKLCLKRILGDSDRQKRKKALARSLFRFQRVEKFSDEGRLIVFVDDVITSGSTAKAAFSALGDPPRFEVWALVSRPKLAGKSPF